MMPEIEKRDLVKLREEEKKLPKAPVSSEDLIVIAEQEETGKIMDTMMKNEHLLRRNKDLFNRDDCLLLYKLPLSDKQRKEVYNDLMKIHNTDSALKE